MNDENWHNDIINTYVPTKAAKKLPIQLYSRLKEKWYRIRKSLQGGWLEVGFTWSDNLHLVAFFCDRLILSPKLSAIPWKKKKKKNN